MQACFLAEHAFYFGGSKNIGKNKTYDSSDDMVADCYARNSDFAVYNKRRSDRP